MAFPVIRADQAEDVRAGLRELLPAGSKALHFYDLSSKARLDLSRELGALTWEAALVVTRLTTSRRQESTRARILTYALPRLEHVEGVTTVLLESRAHADRRDELTRTRLRGSRAITAQLDVRHAGKTGEELTWLADAVVGAFVAKQTHGNAEAWDLLDGARPLEVIWLPQDQG